MIKYAATLLLLAACLIGRAQDERTAVVAFEDAYKRVYHVTRLTGEPPAIDGRLDEDVWQHAGEWSEKFSQVIPFERVHTGSWTRMKIFYDHQAIYVGVYCKDEHPETMNAFIGNRDDNSNGDLISIAFDTYHDYRVAPEFNINLGGNKTDLTVTDQLSVNLSWNAVWEGRTHANLPDSSWTAELRIPFSQLRYNQQDTDGVWGLHVRRIIRRNNEVQNWSLIPIKNNGHVFSFGEMHGMADLPRPRGVEFLPYAMGKFNAGPDSRWGGSAGLDAKVALRDFTLDLTFNPDYGQVEVDPSVMNLSAYEVFYDEKRPFFLEGKHILELDLNEEGKMFYSRRIGAMRTGSDNQQTVIPIIGALKLTGTDRTGLTLGLMESITAKTATDPLTNYTVARVQKNWAGNTLLGGMLTAVNRHLTSDELREQLAGNAFTAGVDMTHYFANRLYYIDAKGMFSTLHGSPAAMLKTKTNAVHYFHRQSGARYLDLDPDSRNLRGTGGYVKVGKKGNAQWNFSQLFSWSSPGFDLNDVGYMKQSDHKLNETEIAFRKTDPWGPFRFAGINLTQQNVWNYGGQAINNDVALRWRSLSIAHRIEMDVKETFSWNTVDSRRLRGGPDLRYNANFETNVSISTDRARRVVYKLLYDGRHYLDESTAYNQVHPGVIFRIGNHMRLAGQFDYAWNKDPLQYVSTIEPAATGEDRAYIMGQMQQRTYGLTLNMQVNLTPDISIQYYGSPFTSVAKYNDFKLATDTRSRIYANRFRPLAQGELNFEDPDFSFNELRSNLVARWEYLPGSTLYLVWQHNRSRRDAIYQPGWEGNLDRLFALPAANALMIKVNYWFSR